MLICSMVLMCTTSKYHITTEPCALQMLSLTLLFLRRDLHAIPERVRQRAEKLFGVDAELSESFIWTFVKSSSCTSLVIHTLSLNGSDFRFWVIDTSIEKSNRGLCLCVLLLNSEPMKCLTFGDCSYHVEQIPVGRVEGRST